MATTSTNLVLSLFAEGDTSGNGHSNWGDSANANFEFLEDAITEVTSKTVTGTDVTLSDAEARSLLIKASGALTGARNIIVPARKHFFMVKNSCTGDYALTVKVSGQTGVVVPASDFAILYCNGTDVEEINKALFKRGNILGTVSESSGTPTGALIEATEGTPDGNNNRTDIVRFADGLQIVSGNLRMTKETDTRLSGTVTFPKSFVDTRYQVTASYRPATETDGPGSIAGDNSNSGREMLAPISGTKAVGSCVICAFSISGAANFSSTSKMYVDFIILGRWF